ncbi:hypothetical protein WN944_023054 [Citrus x changshan-huyou]|uniref:Uncharacterized protein n=1 Tax=Citrus x changshan-huyou TaxID=2935761 RepID=A0AAP0MZL2_9ROSI
MLLKIFQSIHKQIEPIQVDFNPDGEAIAQSGEALGQYIGYLSRDSSVMPLNFDDWRHVSVDVKQEIRNLLEQSNDPEGKELNMITMFTVTHTKKNGQPVDSNSREAINQMNELVNQQPNASKDQIFNQVVEEERSRRQAAENELNNMQEEMNGVKSTLAEVLKYVRAQNEANAIETFDS